MLETQVYDTFLCVFKGVIFIYNFKLTNTVVDNGSLLLFYAQGCANTLENSLLR